MILTVVYLTDLKVKYTHKMIWVGGGWGGTYDLGGGRTYDLSGGGGSSIFTHQLWSLCAGQVLNRPADGWRLQTTAMTESAGKEGRGCGVPSEVVSSQSHKGKGGSLHSQPWYWPCTARCFNHCTCVFVYYLSSFSACQVFPFPSCHVHVCIELSLPCCPDITVMVDWA